MKCTLVGVQDMKFDTREGDKIDGVKLHYVHVDENVFGNKAATSYVKRNVFDSFGVAINDLLGFIDTVVDFEFDPKGKLVGLSV